ncbi:variant erythrocyte surface antigen-1 family protein [Babesia divergens]|uniref:Variant erythrocyte surface antigen-1 family protein n=1 Tax=Babesia divergens TaxID=32595 RepID=A0AAD9GBB5_BABDI|nr:variant erythrocyte surface antigen-1 family protein [Babesia divergens]
MYYTDVFVGTVNINKLKSALIAELKGFNSIDLTQLVQGLCLFMGYPSCLCKPKKSVGESLKKISKELKEELKNYECLLKPSLNCNSSCSDSHVVCKCCVLDCINEVQGSSCQCVKGGSKNCSCSIDDTNKRCCKDLLEKLKASLSLLNLRADMEKLCSCPENCCENGECKASQGCSVCINLQASNTSDYTITGLGLLRPSPKRLAGRLEGFFGGKSSYEHSCRCQCNGSKDPSCCCLACGTGKCSEACSPGCLCPQSGPCPRKVFCEAIQNVKVVAHTSQMKCCDSGTKCHCELQNSSPCSSNCCASKSPSGKSNQQSLKCMLRRLVTYFKDLETSSKKFKSCCDLLCVVKMCHFLWKFYGKRNLNECSKCKSGKSQCSSKAGQCCSGSSPQCSSGSTCQNCSECQQICYAKEFSRALEALKLSSPCGQNLYRVLDDFLYYCCNVIAPQQRAIENKIKGLQEKHCQKASQTPQCCPKDPSKTPCTCPSGSSSCQACQQLSKDSQLKPLLFSEFSSAYSSSASLASSPEDEQKNAAKIFLGMLPCLYYGLKYLNEKCKGDWKDLYISNKDYSPGRFLIGLGFDVEKLQGKKGSDIFGPLSSLFTSSNGPLQSLYEKSKIYFTSLSSRSSPVPSPDSPSQPKTVREILLWLSGLPFTSGFEALLQHCERLCLATQGSVKPENFKASLFDSCFLSPFVLGAIEGSKSDEEALENFPPYKSEISKFSYPEDPSDLLEKLCENARKVFPPLKFLCMQCELDKDQGGWKNCYFGQKCSVNSGSGSFSSSSGCSSCPNSKTYLCTASGSNKDVHGKHCDPKGGGQCINANGGKCDISGSTSKHTSTNCKPCPHPLMRFLCDGSDSSQSQSPSSPFRLPFSFARLDFSQTPPVILDASSDKDFLTMGFDSSKLSPTGRSGESLFVILDIFVGNSNSDQKVCFLRDLLRFLLCLTRTPPETLGELFSFYYKLAEWVKKNETDQKKKDFKTSLETFIDSLPGTYSGQKLTGAVQSLYESEGHKNKNHSDPPYSLKLLAHCWTASGSDPCGNFLFPLATNAWDLFAPSNSDVYLSWLCHLAKDFKGHFKKFQGEFSSSSNSCCSSSSGSQCKILECPCILPKFYKNGFTFMLPSKLSGKNCSNFITQLKAFVTKSTLDDLIEEIENFLWHIRKPFFLFVLAFWAFVISYFLYVQLYKLDLLHLKSHAHFSRSFKILPSTLFSDASSRLKDLSYFTL